MYKEYASKQFVEEYFKNQNSTPDWNQNDETASDYIKNRPFYESDLVETSIFNKTLVFGENTSQITGNDFNYDFIFGQTYYINFNGTIYESEIKVYQDIGAIIYYFGEDDWPFTFITEGNIWAIENISIAAGTYTFEITTTVSEIKKIDEKFLPSLNIDWRQNDLTKSNYIKNRTHYVEELPGESTILADTQEFTVDRSTSYSGLTLTTGIQVTEAFNGLTLGNIYKVTFNDAVYYCKAQDTTTSLSDYAPIIGIGNATLDPNIDEPISEDEPFLFESVLIEGEWQTSITIHRDLSGTTCSVKIEECEVIFHQLSDNFIPDTVARRAEIAKADWDVNDPSMPDYIYHRPFYEIPELPVLLFDGTVTIPDSGYYYDENNLFGFAITPGETYNILFNYINYTLEAYEFSSGYYIGNETPFQFKSYLNSSGIPEQIYFYAAPGDYDIVITQLPKTLVRLDPKFGAIKPGTGFNSEIFNGGLSSIASGAYSHAEGLETTASGETSHAEGYRTIASGYGAHAEGVIGYYDDSVSSTASGMGSHVEGVSTFASGHGAHAEGDCTIASGDCSHAEGSRTEASGNISHAEGSNTNASGYISHAEGERTTASGYISHAEGEHTIAFGRDSHAEGENTIAIGKGSHAEGGGIDNYYLSITGDAGTTTYTVSSWDDNINNSNYKVQTVVYNDNVAAKIIDYDQTNLTITLSKTLQSYSSLSEREVIVYIGGATGEYSHAEGQNTAASGNSSHAEGYQTTASEGGSHAEGYQTTASGFVSHTEGWSTTASGFVSHAEGEGTTASGDHSHAEGMGTTASGDHSSHAEGYDTTASGNYGSHAEGYDTTASGWTSHAEGQNTTASGYCSHAEGWSTTASGDHSHVEGYGTIASSSFQHVQGKYNIEDASSTFSHIVGNGDGVNVRSNAHTLDWDGNAWFAGDVYVDSTSGTNKDEGSKKLATEEYVGTATTSASHSLIDQNTGNQIQIWHGSTSEYDAIETKAENVLYILNDEVGGEITATDITYNNINSGLEATTIQTAIDKTIEYVNIRVPAWTAEDEGKFLRIVNGVPAWSTV